MTIALDRRTLLASALIGGGLIAAPAILRAQQLFTDYPFTLGVAAGDPSPDGFVIWTRLAPDPLAPHGGMPLGPIAVDWEVASDNRFTAIVAKGSAVARPEIAHTLHVEVTGLQPARPYWYRFTIGRTRSPRGQARTTPPPGARLDRLRFGVVGCQNYEDGYYTAYRHISQEGDLDFVYHYGDYIYEYRADPIDYEGAARQVVRRHESGECLTLDDYRRRYAQYKLDPDLRAAHAAAAWWTVFDDHEVQNNWAGLIDQNDSPPELFAFRREAAFQAWYEHTPVRRAQMPSGDAVQLYRRARYGDLVDLHLLDTRQYRTDQPCGDNFKAVCPGVSDPAAQMPGLAQEKWLADGLRQGRGRWQAVAQQVMMMPLDRRTDKDPGPIRNMDSWAGYDAPRERVLGMFKGRGDVIVLTGDEHQNFAGELRTRGGAGEAAAIEFVGTSISSGGDGRDRRSTYDKIMADNPFLKFTNDQRGYLICEATPDRWDTRFRVVDQISKPDGVISTRATATVERGKVGVTMG